MKLSRNRIIFAASIFLFLTLLGCQPVQPVYQMPAPNPPVSAAQTQADAKRFEDPSTKKATVVESAMELSEKYADVSEELADLKDKNLKLNDENQKLKEELNSTQLKLNQTQKELSEANNLLIEMRVELNDWKTDVLGFRDEMREAETEQLKALLNILKILGGEPQMDIAETDPNAAVEQVTPSNQEVK